jgi:hypothetical protein
LTRVFLIKIKNENHYNDLGNVIMVFWIRIQITICSCVFINWVASGFSSKKIDKKFIYLLVILSTHPSYQKSKLFILANIRTWTFELVKPRDFCKLSLIFWVLSQLFCSVLSWFSEPWVLFVFYFYCRTFSFLALVFVKKLNLLKL